MTQGIALRKILVFIGLGVVLVIVLISFLSSDAVRGEPTIAGQLEYIGSRAGRTFTDIRVDQQTETHARGRLRYAEGNSQENFYAQKIGDTWTIVSIGDDAPSCELYTLRGFTEAFLYDCHKTYPGARSVSEAKTFVAQSQEKRSFFQMIAEVSGIKKVTDSLLSFFTGEGDGATDGVEAAEEEYTVLIFLDDEGEEFEVVVEGDVDVEVGDMVVVDVVAEKDTTTGGTQSQGKVISNVSTDSTAIPVLVSDDTTEQDPDISLEDDTDEEQSPTGKRIILRPPSSIYELENVFDIDNSGVDIRVNWR